MLTVICLEIIYISLSCAQMGGLPVVPDSCDFSKVVQSAAYVDNTLLVRQIMRYGSLLVTAPRGFLKTTNLHMIDTFLSFKVDQTGTLVVPRLTEDYKSFTNTIVYKTERAYFDMHFGKWPVLHLDLKTEEPITSYDEALEVLRGKIHLSFKQHAYLPVSTVLYHTDKTLAKQWIDDAEYKNISARLVMEGLSTLAEYLFKHYNRQVYILVDDYDAIIYQAMTTVKDKQEFRHIVQLVTSQISDLFKLKNLVTGGFITGISHIHGTGFSQIKYFKVFRSFEDHPLKKFFSFSEEEVKTLSNTFKLSDAQKDAKEWCGGYCCLLGGEIYNPSSVLTFVKYGKVKSHWKQSEYAYRIEKLFENPVIRNQTELLLQGQNIYISHPKWFEINDLLILRNVFTEAQGSELSINLVILHLLDLGYLTYSSSKTKDDLVGVKIPNHGVGEYIVSKWKNYYVQECKVEESQLKEVNFTNFKYLFEKILNI